MKTTYTYAILRYIHDPSTAEFVNVGVAMYAPEARFAGALCRNTYKRLSGLFPDFDGHDFRDLTRFVQREFRRFHERLQETDFFPERLKSVLPMAHAVLPPNDNSYRWSEPAGGITDHPEGALQKIFDRMVSRYDEPAGEVGRRDEDVRSQLEQEFQQQGVRGFLRPKQIIAPKEDFSFQLAYKNGSWNCLESISLDMAQPGDIKNKARRWLGLAMGLSKSPEDFRINLVVAEPTRPDRTQKRAVEQAFGLLEEMPGEHQIVRESKIKEFAEEFAAQVREHEREHPTP